VPTGTARRRAEAAEAALARASQSLAKIDAALTDPKLFSQDPAKAADLGRQRMMAEAALEAAELEWMEAVEAYEAIKGDG
ncbi:MAG: ABC transporter ATP-binding protein, partial [Phenylobacterium sp.]